MEQYRIWKALAILVCATLLAPTAISHPLINTPTLNEVLSRLQLPHKTFLCYCEISDELGNLDTRGCATKGDRAVLGNIITPAMVIEWLNSTQSIPVADIDRYISNVIHDPLNMAVFNDSIWEVYRTSSRFSGTDTINQNFGACPISFHNGTARIVDGRIPEVARTALYLIDRYQIPAQNQTIQHFKEINDMTFPSDEEVNRNKQAHKWNGTWSLYVDDKPPSNHYSQHDQVIDGVMKGIFNEIIR